MADHLRVRKAAAQIHRDDPCPEGWPESAKLRAEAAIARSVSRPRRGHGSHAYSGATGEFDFRTSATRAGGFKPGTPIPSLSAVRLGGMPDRSTPVSWRYGRRTVPEPHIADPVAEADIRGSALSSNAVEREGDMVTVPAPDSTSGRKTQKDPTAVGSAPTTAGTKPSRAKQRSKIVDARNAVSGSEPVQMAVLRRATDMGLMGTEIYQVGVRIPKKLLAQAKKRTGIASTTELLKFALANVAVEDNFAKAFSAARGRIAPDLVIGF